MTGTVYGGQVKSLRQPIRAGLYRIPDVHAPAGTVAQQLGKTRRVLGRAD